MSYSDFDSGPDYLAPMAQDDEIGARVREVRGSATQEAFGKRLGVSRGAVALARFARNFIGLQET